MRLARTKAVTAAAALAVGLAACGDAGTESQGGAEVDVQQDTSFPEDSTMAG